MRRLNLTWFVSMKLFLAALVALSTLGCVATTDETDAHSLKSLTVYVPENVYLELNSKEQFTGEELVRLKKQYSEKAGSDAVTQPPRRVDYGACVLGIDSGSLYDRGTKFRVTGVTEEWIPINGKPTKILHLRLVQ